MAEDFLRNHPGLRPFVLSDVELTGTEIGGGAYGKVELSAPQLKQSTPFCEKPKQRVNR